MIQMRHSERRQMVGLHSNEGSVAVDEGNVVVGEEIVAVQEVPPGDAAGPVTTLEGISAAAHEEEVVAGSQAQQLKAPVAVDDMVPGLALTVVDITLIEDIALIEDLEAGLHEAEAQVEGLTVVADPAVEGLTVVGGPVVEDLTVGDVLVVAGLTVVAALVAVDLLGDVALDVAAARGEAVDAVEIRFICTLIEVARGCNVVMRVSCF